ncbi:MAG: porin family protein [Marinoscillum sp.]
MKKLFFTTALCLLAFFGFSQAKVELGLKGGLNLTNINTEEPGANFENATGYHGGLYLLVKAASFGVQPEILYSTRGAKGDVTIAGVKEDFQQDFVYLDIPIMAKLYLPLGLNLQVGPQFGLLMSADGTTADYDGDGDPDPISKDTYKNADISAAFGAGWDAPFGLRFMARYIVGLNDINDFAGAQEAAKNRMFQVSLGYKLFKVGN